jgi:hypothetical protein
LFVFLLQQLTRLVIASAVGLFLFAALNMLGLVKPVVDNPHGYVFWFTMLYISLNYVALTHILSFHPTKGAKSKSPASTEVKTATMKSEKAPSSDKNQSSENADENA